MVRGAQTPQLRHPPFLDLYHGKRYHFGIGGGWHHQGRLKVKKIGAVTPAKTRYTILVAKILMRVRTASHPPFLELHLGVRTRDRQGEHDLKSVREQSGLGVECEH